MIALPLEKSAMIKNITYIQSRKNMIQLLYKNIECYGECKMNKRINKIIVIMSFLLLPSIVFASTITVTDSDVKIDDEKKIIYGIDFSKYPTAEAIKELVGNNEITVMNNSNQEIENSEIIKTGYKIKINNETYKLSIKGDVLGEGIMSDKSAKKIAKHIIDKNVITGDEYLLSANYNNKSTIKMNDVIGILKNRDVAVELKIPQDVNVIVNDGITGDGNIIYPNFQSINNKEIVYYYNITKKGGYQFTSNGDGYYTYKKSFVVNNLNNRKSIDANPGKMAGKGWEISNDIVVHAYADEMIEKVKIPQALADQYSWVFTTPSFSAQKAKNEFTNATDINNFIVSLNNINDNLYLFSAGETTADSNGETLNIPLVIFTKTNLRECEQISNQEAAIECAAEKINNNNKLTIGYTAQIHGNEPAATDGALAMIKALDETYGNQLLDKVNVYVIPQYNGYGSKINNRYNANKIDMNRNQLYVSQKEVQEIHKIYNLFMPEAVVDTHEQFAYNYKTNYTDVSIGMSYSNNSPTELNALTQTIFQQLYNDIEKLGLNVTVYNGECNSTNNAISRPYYGLYGSISLLVETNGIHGGKELWENRVFNQYITCEKYFNYIASNATSIKNTIATARNEVINEGKEYNQNNLLTLKHGSNKTNNITYQKRNYNLLTGEYTEETKIAYWNDKTLNSRPRPTAYLISKDTKNARTAINKLKLNGISCYESINGATYAVMQYSGDETAATLSEEKKVTFPNGAYICTMNQTGGNVLAMTMEPDVLDTNGYKGTFVQSDLLSTEDIYRSHKKLITSTSEDAINGMKLPRVS